MGLSYSELTSSGKVLPTPLSTSTEGGMNKQLTADSMKGGKKSKKPIKKTGKKKTGKKIRKTEKKIKKTGKSWFFL